MVGKSGKSRSSMTLLSQAEVSKSGSCSKTTQQLPESGHVCTRTMAHTSLSAQHYLTVLPGTAEHSSGSVSSTLDLCKHPKEENISSTSRKHCFKPRTEGLQEW